MGNSVQFQTFMETLTGPSCNANASIDSISKLLEAEEAMDAIAAVSYRGMFYRHLEEHAEKYLKANLCLLTEPWLRTGGAVYDMHEKLRAAKLATCRLRSAI